MAKFKKTKDLLSKIEWEGGLDEYYNTSYFICVNSINNTAGSWRGI